MKKILLTFILLLVPVTAFATSWAYEFVVYNDAVYVVTGEAEGEVGEKLGEVTYYSDMYTHSGNFSNHYPKGTEYYEIIGVDPSEMIAVRVQPDRYLRATYEHSPSAGEFVETISERADPVNEPVVKEGGYLSWVVIIGAILVLGLVLGVLRSERKRKK